MGFDSPMTKDLAELKANFLCRKEIDHSYVIIKMHIFSSLLSFAFVGASGFQSLFVRFLEHSNVRGHSCDTHIRRGSDIEFYLTEI
jgi:hypothetical protein